MLAICSGCPLLLLPSWLHPADGTHTQMLATHQAKALQLKTDITFIDTSL